MSKNIISILITIALTSLAVYLISKAYFTKEVTGIRTMFQSCTDKCDLLPYAIYEEKLAAFNICKEKNDSLRALLKDCSHIYDEEARERCEEKNNQIMAQVMVCYLPIPPRYQEYLECLESNAAIRGKLRQCLPYKPNYEKCLEENEILRSQLVNCDSILLVAEIEYRKCKGKCENLITLY
ncbi:MAG: hypothetical protein IPM42_19575 [Saprospiraceae bacterium]|nr:hypothetical protein [Saprospiraceae bacterium]